MKKFLIAICAALLLASPAAAQAATQAELVKKVEDYFRGLKTMKAGFIQTASDGAELTGQFYLSRPGRLRFDYDPPLEDFIVADGVFVYYYDGELKQQSNAPVGQTLGYYILRKNVSLTDELTVNGISEDGEFLEVSVTQTADPAAGALTMYFEKDPVALKKWSVVDAQGLVTKIELVDPVRDIRLKNSLFTYSDPEGVRLNR